jgi:hypothetical protein
MSDTNKSNAVVPTPQTGNSAMSQIANLTGGVASLWSSIQGDTQADRVQILAAVTDAEPISEHLGETLHLRHVIAQATQIEDDKTGELNDAIRTILITEEGDAYAAVSVGLFQYLKNLFDIVGHPSTWDGPLPIQVVEKKGRKGYRFMTVKMVSE